MKLTFADTGYWIALVNPDDALHASAKSISRSLSPMKIITSEMVLTELLNAFCRKGETFRKTAVEFVQDLYEDSDIEIVPQSSDRFKAALRLYEQRLDQAWSLTDCDSFQIMQQRKIQEALAYDRHFEQAGFMALLR